MTDILTVEAIADRIVWDKRDDWAGANGYEDVHGADLEKLIIEGIKQAIEAQAEDLIKENHELKRRIKGIEAPETWDLETIEYFKRVRDEGRLNPIYMNLFATIEAQAAEIKGLREALEDVRKELDFGSGASIEAAYHCAKQALSRTPAEWVEGERLREDLVRTSLNLYDWQGSEWLSRAGQRGDAFSSAVEAYKAWEGGK